MLASDFFNRCDKESKKLLVTYLTLMDEISLNRENIYDDCRAVKITSNSKNYITGFKDNVALYFLFVGLCKSKTIEKIYQNHNVNWITVSKYYTFPDLVDHFKTKKCKLPTIEFRVANGSLNPRIIQNVIRFFCQLVSSVLEENSLLDYYIDKHFDNLKSDKYIEEAIISYQEIDFDKALELVDIICNNNMDKLCFLKQYLKEEEIEEARVYIK